MEAGKGRMTMVESHKLDCPKCGHLQDASVWSTLNVTLSPDLREKLFNDEINVFACQKCGNRVLINVALLYHDMERKYCVQYCPVQRIDDPEFLKMFTKDGTLNVDWPFKRFAEDDDYILEPHIVFDLYAMIQYIRFRDKLHDLHKELIS